jgi:hypothetical protein
MDGIVTLTALLSGLAFGMGLRVAMRVVAFTDAEPGTTFTVGGTVGILIGAVMASVAFAAAYLAVRRLLPSSVLARRLAFGVVVLVVPGLPFLGGFPEIREIGIPWLNRVMFGGVIIGWGMAIAASFEWLDRRVARPAVRHAERFPRETVAAVR